MGKVVLLFFSDPRFQVFSGSLEDLKHKYREIFDNDRIEKIQDQDMIHLISNSRVVQLISFCPRLRNYLIQTENKLKKDSFTDNFQDCPRERNSLNELSSFTKLPKDIVKHLSGFLNNKDKLALK